MIALSVGYFTLVVRDCRVSWRHQRRKERNFCFLVRGLWATIAAVLLVVSLAL